MRRLRYVLLSAAVAMGILACGDSNDENRTNIPEGTGVEWIEIENDAQAAAVDSAFAWVGMIDLADYAESWTAASPTFRGAVTSEQWISAMESARGPLGTMNTRDLASAKAAASLPGAPDGRYVVMTFKTSFSNKNLAVETITMIQTDSGWQAVGYFIR
jgi:hypothetical protein